MTRKHKSTKQTRNPVRKLSKTGKYSYSITVPKDLIKELKWKERQRLVVKKRGQALSIVDYKPKK